MTDNDHRPPAPSVNIHVTGPQNQVHVRVQGGPDDDLTTVREQAFEALDRAEDSHVLSKGGPR